MQGTGTAPPSGGDVTRAGLCSLCGGRDAAPCVLGQTGISARPHAAPEELKPKNQSLGLPPSASIQSSRSLYKPNGDKSMPWPGSGSVRMHRQRLRSKADAALLLSLRSTPRPKTQMLKQQPSSVTAADTTHGRSHAWSRRPGHSRDTGAPTSCALQTMGVGYTGDFVS